MDYKTAKQVIGKLRTLFGSLQAITEATKQQNGGKLPAGVPSYLLERLESFAHMLTAAQTLAVLDAFKRKRSEPGVSPTAELTTEEILSLTLKGDNWRLLRTELDFDPKLLKVGHVDDGSSERVEKGRYRERVETALRVSPPKSIASAKGHAGAGPDSARPTATSAQVNHALAQFGTRAGRARLERAATPESTPLPQPPPVVSPEVEVPSKAPTAETRTPNSGEGSNSDAAPSPGSDSPTPLPEKIDRILEFQTAVSVIGSVQKITKLDDGALAGHLRMAPEGLKSIREGRGVIGPSDAERLFRLCGGRVSAHLFLKLVDRDEWERAYQKLAAASAEVNAGL